MVEDLQKELPNDEIYRNFSIVNSNNEFILNFWSFSELLESNKFHTILFSLCYFETFQENFKESSKKYST